jgi:hypothetical protein
MLMNLSDDAAGQDDAALAGGGLGWREEDRLAVAAAPEGPVQVVLWRVGRAA